eukprot:6179058-Pleurochrysis_carterae.AAC.2
MIRAGLLLNDTADSLKYFETIHVRVRLRITDVLQKQKQRTRSIEVRAVANARLQCALCSRPRGCAEEIGSARGRQRGRLAAQRGRGSWCSSTRCRAHQRTRRARHRCTMRSSLAGWRTLICSDRCWAWLRARRRLARPRSASNERRSCAAATNACASLVSVWASAHGAGQSGAGQVARASLRLAAKATDAGYFVRAAEDHSGLGCAWTSESSGAAARPDLS